MTKEREQRPRHPLIDKALGTMASASLPNGRVAIFATVGPHNLENIVTLGVTGFSGPGSVAAALSEDAVYHRFFRTIKSRSSSPASQNGITPLQCDVMAESPSCSPRTS